MTTSGFLSSHAIRLGGSIRSNNAPASQQQLDNALIIFGAGCNRQGPEATQWPGQSHLNSKRRFSCWYRGSRRSEQSSLSLDNPVPFQYSIHVPFFGLR